MAAVRRRGQHINPHARRVLVRSTLLRIDAARRGQQGDGAQLLSHLMETPREYLARIGAAGGRKSKRKLSSKEASRIARIGHTKRQQYSHVITAPASPAK